jgi:hypothetical protein
VNNQASRTLQEARTTAAPSEVQQLARRFFSRQNNVYAAFLETESDRHHVFRGQGGEELVIAVEPGEGSTRVTGSTYMFDQQLARFLATLPPAPEVSAA